MSQRVFHNEHRQEPCGKCVDFFGISFFRTFSTGFSLGFCTSFVVEKASDLGLFPRFQQRYQHYE